jgi:hypothetical protein
VLDPDFNVRNRGGIFLLTPQTLRAESWCTDHLASIPRTDRTYSISSAADFANIINAITEAGFTVKEKRTVN